MVYKKYKDIIKSIDGYQVESRLLYKYGFSREDIKLINKQKHLDDDYIKLPLYNESDVPLLYYNSETINNLFMDAENIIKDSNLQDLNHYKDSEMLNGFIFSEIESTLAIEGVRSTRAEIQKLSNIDYDDILEQNDIIIKNMLLGYDFARENEITKENIYKLYTILSKQSLNEDERLIDDNYYRHHGVDIVDSYGNVVDRGVSYNLLPRMMDDLIKYIQFPKPYKDHLIASHVIHYYLVYLHPYFDYNGRMARVMSFWYNYQTAPSLSLLLVNEAINNKSNKSGYYNAIVNSRTSGNDITYFLEYMASIVLKYSKLYVNLTYILENLKGDGYLLTRAEELALKYVLTIPVIGDGYFTWRDYQMHSYENHSKQYILRLLNKLVDLDILELKESKKNNLYRTNSKKLYI